MVKIKTNITSDSTILLYAKDRAKLNRAKKKYDLFRGAVMVFSNRRGRKTATIIDLPHYLFAGGFARFAFKKLPRFMKAATTRDQLADPPEENQESIADLFFDDVLAPTRQRTVTLGGGDFDPVDEDIKFVGGWSTAGNQGFSEIVSDTIFSDLRTLSDYYNATYIDREPFVKDLSGDRWFFSLTFCGSFGTVLRIRVPNEYLKEISGGYGFVTDVKKSAAATAAFHGGVQPGAAPANYVHLPSGNYTSATVVANTSGSDKPRDFGTPAILLTYGRVRSFSAGSGVDVTLRLLEFPQIPQFPQETGGYPSLDTTGELVGEEDIERWSVFSALGVATDGREDVVYGSYFTAMVGTNDSGRPDYYSVETLFRITAPRGEVGSDPPPAQWEVIKCYESDYGPGSHALNTSGETVSGFIAPPVVAMKPLSPSDAAVSGRNSDDWAIVPRVFVLDIWEDPRPWMATFGAYTVEHPGYPRSGSSLDFIRLPSFLGTDLVVLKNGEIVDEGAPEEGALFVARPPSFGLSFGMRHPPGDYSFVRFADEYVDGDTVGFVFCIADSAGVLRLGFWNSFEGFGYFDIDVSHLWPNLPDSLEANSEPAQFIPYGVGVSVYRRCYEEVDSQGNVTGVAGDLGAILSFPAMGEIVGGTLPAGIALVNGKNVQWVSDEASLSAIIVGNSISPANNPSSSIYRRT